MLNDLKKTEPGYEEAGGLSRNMLKLIAIFFIVTGHFILYTRTTFGFQDKWMAYLGTSCFIGPPIFMFFIAEGFIHTRSRKRYGTRLLVFALITQIAFAITTSEGNPGFNIRRFFLEWNVFFMLFLGFIDLYILSSARKVPVKCLLILLTLILSFSMSTEWAVFGQLMIIAFYLLREHKVLKFLTASALCYLTLVFGDCLPTGDFTVNWYTPGIFKWFLFGVVGIALVCFFYHGKNGRKSTFMKYFFYITYPLHLLIIDVVIIVQKIATQT